MANTIDNVPTEEQLTPEEVKTDGYFYVADDTKLLVEDIMYNLVKLQMEITKVSY